MISLKEKAISPKIINATCGEKRRFLYEDVKQAVLDFEKEIESWKLNSSKSINTDKRNNLIDSILKYHKKIFGEFGSNDK